MVVYLDERKVAMKVSQEVDRLGNLSVDTKAGQKADLLAVLTVRRLVAKKENNSAVLTADWMARSEAVNWE